ncbi:hypothetical protein A0J61_00710 [Choanephora cucurbitarum]|uniref:C2H2-type domain-containing protein n=1 Tax=Choanephora cucurbitarum TaxID=101091 RepID=A0A1C7NQ54_9FUNG|nr:hypothetical protein A0J61_00710 [Choanephora cucurbitarum]
MYSTTLYSTDITPIATSTNATSPNNTDNTPTVISDHSTKHTGKITISTSNLINHSDHHYNSAEWPLEEYEERRIMFALSQTSSPTSVWFEESKEEEEGLSPNGSYFSDKAIFQLSNHIRRQSLSTSLRCSICQRRFHSQGNLSNHYQLYH